MNEQGDKLGIQSAEVAADVLSALTRLGRPVQLKDLALEAKMAPAKVHRYLVSLVRTNLVSQDPLSGRYSIGYQSILMGLVGLRSLDVVRSASIVLPTLRERTGETAILAIWTENGPIVVEFDESDRPIYMNVRVGSVLPLGKTATGFAFAAHLNQETVQQLIKEHLTHQLPVSKRAGFQATLKHVRKDGYASVHGGLVSGVSAVAAPVFDHNGRVAAVMGIVGRQEDVEDVATKKIVPVLLDLTQQLSRQLGAGLQTA